MAPVFRDSDSAVANREVINAFLRRGVPGPRLGDFTLMLLDAHNDFAFFRKFNRISKEVRKDLAQARDVAMQGVWQSILDEIGQIQFLCAGSGADQIESFLNAEAQIERQFLQVQFARFNFGEVEDVIDYSQESVAADTNRVDKATLLLGKIGRKQQ